MPPRWQGAADWASGEIASPHWVNATLLLCTVATIVINVWSFGAAMLGVALVYLVPLNSMVARERRWRRNHPGQRPRAGPPHLLVGGGYVLLLAVYVAGLLARH